MTVPFDILVGMLTVTLTLI